MKKYLIMFLVLLNGCSLLNTTTTIETPDGSKYIVSAKSDALVEFEKDGVKIKSDNRGRPSFLETVFSALVFDFPDKIDSN